MKYFQIIVFVFLLISCEETDPGFFNAHFLGSSEEVVTEDDVAPERYDAFNKEYHTTFFYDGFADNSNDWFTGTGDGSEAFIQDGAYMCETKPDNPKIFMLEKSTFDETKNYEIEVHVNYYHTPYSSDSAFCGMMFGLQKSPLKTLHFSLSDEGDYAIGEYNDGWDHWESYTHFEAIFRGSMNKLTLRKYKGQFYYFINEEFVTSHEKVSLYGKAFGFWISAETKASFDAISIDYLESK